MSDATESKNTVTVCADGPYLLKGQLNVDGATAEMPNVGTEAALCRCGGSQNMPFCDGSHNTNGFEDAGAVSGPGNGFETEGGELKVLRAKNGPLLLSGNFSIVAASGEVAFRGTKCALCRCGKSKNKPFCDGAHKDAFEAD